MSVFTGRAENTVNAVWRLLIRLTIIAGVVYSCYRLRGIIATLFVAAIIAYVLDPMVEWLCRQKSFIRFHTACASLTLRFRIWYQRNALGRATTPEFRVRVRRHTLRTIATLYVFIAAIVVLWKGTEVIIRPFVQQFQQLADPVKQEELRQKAQASLARYDKYAPEWAKSDKIEKTLKSSEISKTLQEKGSEIGQRVLASLKYVVEIVLLPVLAFYFLIDGRTLKHEFISLLPRSRIKEALRLSREFNLIMRAFIAGQFILCSLAGIVVGLGLALLQVQYALVLGVLAGVTRAIPIIGPIIGGIPIILLTYVSQGPVVAMGVLGFFTFLHFAESKFIMPLLIGDRMELHPVVIIVVLIVGGELGGMIIGGQIGALLGMFFAAPLAAIARVIIRRYWLQIREKPHAPPPRRPETFEVVEAVPASLPKAVE